MIALPTYSGETAYSAGQFRLRRCALCGSRQSSCTDDAEAPRASMNWVPIFAIWHKILARQSVYRQPRRTHYPAPHKVVATRSQGRHLVVIYSPMPGAW